MEFAKKSYVAALKQLSILPDMSEDSLTQQLGLFWDRLFAGISNAMGSGTPEKDIYRVLIARQKTLPPLHLWKVQTSLPQPVRKSQTGPDIQLILTEASMALALASALLAFLSAEMVLTGVCLAAMVLMGGAAVLHLSKKKEIQPPPPATSSYSWDIPAIQSYLATAAASIDADVVSLIPRNNSQPEALSLVAELMRQVYQGSLPNGEMVMGQIQTYLLRHNIEKVDYSPETAGMFTVLPANGEKTLAPALVRDGQVLSKGTACIKM